jgi:amidase
MTPFCQHAKLERRGSDHGPLQGYRFAVQDVFGIEGVTSCYGNPAWLGAHEPAQRTAACVQTLLAAGAQLDGLTLSDELALGSTGENVHYGTPENPRCPERVPGGAASGSAVAVAAGLVDFALGTDTGGSVRVPASHNGIFGFRPSHGAISLADVLPLAPRFDTVGWFARDAELLERVGSVLLPELGDAPLPTALVLWRTLSKVLDAEARTPFTRAARELARALDVPLHEPPAPDTAPWLEALVTLQNLEVARHHRAFIERHRSSFGALIGRRLDGVLTTDPERAPGAEKTRAALEVVMAGAFARGAWLVVPSAPGAAPRRGLSDEASDDHTSRSLTLCAPASLSGSPQLSLPMSSSEGYPFGVSLLAPRGADRALLRAARNLSQQLEPLSKG